MATMYNIHQKMNFEITSKSPVSPEDVNPLLRKLRYDLDHLNCEENNLRGVIDDVDEFIVEQENSHLVKGSYKIRWNCWDLGPDENAPERFNNVLRAVLARWLKMFSFEASKANPLSLEITEIRNLG